MDDEVTLNPEALTPKPEYTSKLAMVRDTIMELAQGSDKYAIVDMDRGIQILMDIKTTAQTSETKGE